MYGIVEIKKALKDNTRIADLSEGAILNQLSVYLKYVYNDLGQVPHEDDVAYLKAQLVKLLQAKYGHLNISEVGLAFRNGIQKVYGEYYGINFVSLSMFIKSYSESQERCDARVQLQTETRSSRLLEAPEQKFDGEAWVAKLYAEFLEKGTCEDHGNLAYDYLNRIGKIKFSNEQKEAIWNEAQEFCRNKLNAEKDASRNIFALRELEKKLIEVLEEKQSPMVVVKAKQLALIEYFKINSSARE